MPQLTSRFLVDLLLRKAQAAGGFATVIAHGDDGAGTILVQCRERGVEGPMLERRFSINGGYCWESIGPDAGADAETRAQYCERRRNADPDLWIIELDIVDAPRLVAQWGALT